MFATQAGIRPPRFVLFTTGLLDAGYLRFIERKLREEFGFEGTPIEMSVKAARAGGARSRRADARSPLSARGTGRRTPSA